MESVSRVKPEIFHIFSRSKLGGCPYKTREYISRSGVPLPNVYSLISGAFCMVYTDETKVPGIKAAAPDE